MDYVWSKQYLREHAAYIKKQVCLHEMLEDQLIDLQNCEV